MSEKYFLTPSAPIEDKSKDPKLATHRINPKTGRYILVGGRTDRRLQLEPYRRAQRVEAALSTVDRPPPKPKQRAPPPPVPELQQPTSTFLGSGLESYPSLAPPPPRTPPPTPAVTKNFDFALTNPKDIVYPPIWQKYGLL